jgi:hypothetical protein
MEGPGGRDAHLKGNHELCKTTTIDEHDLGIDVFDVRRRVGREGTSGDENALLGTLSVKSAYEFLDLGPANGALPPLGL